MANNSDLRKMLIGKTKAQISEAYASEEFALIQAINAYLELSKQYNLINERLAEWNGIYVPELRMNNVDSLARVAIAISSGEINMDLLKSILPEEGKAESAYKRISESMGRKMNADESTVFKSFAEYSISTQKAMVDLEAYLKLATNRILPNATYLTDEKIAAELLSKAGSMERLANFSAGTIQLLGAEKALFKHIKYGSKPPKYGVLFKLSAVTSAPKGMKGKIARAYATKLAIAIRADYFSKRFIAEDLKKDLQESIKRMKEAPPKPQSEQKHEQKPAPSFRKDFHGRKPNFGGSKGKYPSRDKKRKF